MRPLVVLRPEPGASATVRRAGELGLRALAVPLFRIEPLAWRMPADLAQFDGLLLTSANAVRQAGPQLGALALLPVFAVGEATAAAAREAGLSVAATGEAGIDALLSGLPDELRLLHLCGEERREPAESRQSIAALPVYRAAPLEPPSEIAALNGAVVLVHSPAAGRRLAELVEDRSQVALAAISRAAAEACGTGWLSVSAAGHPDDACLLSLAATLCQESAPE